MEGKILGKRYEIISLLGRGAFGTTFLAVDRQLPDNPSVRCSRNSNPWRVIH